MSLSTKIKKTKRYLSNSAFYRYLAINTIRLFYLNKPPVIICGCPRSGTTLLMSILDTHPEINVIQFETAVLQYRTKSRRFFKNKYLHHLLCRVQIVLYLFANKIKRTSNRWCEKTPLNILNVEEIREIYKGNIQFINIIRDGRAVVSSKHSRFGYMVTPDLWMKCIDIARNNESQKDFLSIRYEHLIKEPEVVLKSIQEFLNLKTSIEHNNFINNTRVKGKVKNITSGKFEGSEIWQNLDEKKISDWNNSQSPNLILFLKNSNCMNLNKQLGYD